MSDRINFLLSQNRSISLRIFQTLHAYNSAVSAKFPGVHIYRKAVLCLMDEQDSITNELMILTEKELR